VDLTEFSSSDDDYEPNNNEQNTTIQKSSLMCTCTANEKCAQYDLVVEQLTHQI
jgi:hypothetical protein